jgi:hypothetical protein
MANYAVVKDGIVETVVVWDGITNFSVPGAELIEATATARTGATWDGSVFSYDEPVMEPDTYDVLRRSEYPSMDELIVALWEGVVEERMAAITALEAVRQAVKVAHPKP